MVVKPPTRQPRNVKFRLWLSVELIYMPLMSPPPAVLAEETTLFTKAWTLAFQLMHFQNEKKSQFFFALASLNLGF